jgi:hypothetical protein
VLRCLSIYSPVLNLCTIYFNIRIVWTFPRVSVFLIILTPIIVFPYIILTLLLFKINASHVLCEEWTEMLHIKRAIMNYWKFKTRFINERCYFKNYNWMYTTTNTQYGRVAIWALRVLNPHGTVYSKKIVVLVVCVIKIWMAGCTSYTLLYLNLFW